MTMFDSRLRRRAAQAALASAFFVAIGAAAQPGPGAGPGAGPGPGAGFGPHARGAHVEQVIAHLRSQLNLNTQQQQQFDNAVAAGRAAREQARAEGTKVRDAVRAELASNAPNLRNIAALGDQTRAALAVRHAQVRDQWLALYDTFSAEQKLVVRDAMLKRMERMEHFRERMRERFPG
jgi:Spy/CpxP family protein refolding chaperone